MTLEEAIDRLTKESSETIKKYRSDLEFSTGRKKGAKSIRRKKGRKK